MFAAQNGSDARFDEEILALVEKDEQKEPQHSSFLCEDTFCESDDT